MPPDYREVTVDIVSTDPAISGVVADALTVSGGVPLGITAHVDNCDPGTITFSEFDGSITMPLSSDGMLRASLVDSGAVNVSASSPDGVCMGTITLPET